MEKQNETQQAQEEITQTEVSIDPKMQPATIDSKLNDLQMINVNDGVRMINVKDYVHVDPDMIPFNDLQMTPQKYLAIKLMLKSYKGEESADYVAESIFSFARGD